MSPTKPIARSSSRSRTTRRPPELSLPPPPLPALPRHLPTTSSPTTYHSAAPTYPSPTSYHHQPDTPTTASSKDSPVIKIDGVAEELTTTWYDGGGGGEVDNRRRFGGGRGEEDERGWGGDSGGVGRSGGAGGTGAGMGGGGAEEGGYDMGILEGYEGASPDPGREGGGFDDFSRFISSAPPSIPALPPSPSLNMSSFFGPTEPLPSSSSSSKSPLPSSTSNPRIPSPSLYPLPPSTSSSRQPSPSSLHRPNETPLPAPPAMALPTPGGYTSSFKANAAAAAAAGLGTSVGPPRSASSLGGGNGVVVNAAGGNNTGGGGGGGGSRSSPQSSRGKLPPLPPSSFAQGQARSPGAERVRDPSPVVRNRLPKPPALPIPPPMIDQSLPLPPPPTPTKPVISAPPTPVKQTHLIPPSGGSSSAMSRSGGSSNGSIGSGVSVSSASQYSDSRGPSRAASDRSGREAMGQGGSSSSLGRPPQEFPGGVGMGKAGSNSSLGSSSRDLEREREREVVSPTRRRLPSIPGSTSQQWLQDSMRAESPTRSQESSSRGQGSTQTTPTAPTRPPRGASSLTSGMGTSPIGDRYEGLPKTPVSPQAPTRPPRAPASMSPPSKAGYEGVPIPTRQPVRLMSKDISAVSDETSISPPPSYQFEGRPGSAPSTNGFGKPNAGLGIDTSLIPRSLTVPPPAASPMTPGYGYVLPTPTTGESEHGEGPVYARTSQYGTPTPSVTSSTTAQERARNLPRIQTDMSMGHGQPPQSQQQPRSASLGGSSLPPRGSSKIVGVPGKLSSPPPVSATRQGFGQAVQRQEEQDEKTPTEITDDVMLEILSGVEEDNWGKSPAQRLQSYSGRSTPNGGHSRDQSRDSSFEDVRGMASPTILDRPRPAKRSSTYKATPKARSPTPQQDGFASFRAPSRSAGNRFIQPPTRRRTGKATLNHVLIEEGVQQALFPFLPITSFLALLGSIGTGARRMIAGEVVGKWVCREWGVTVNGNESWPGLGVWEGFLESLLHDFLAFPTYPPHFNPLLQHLSLSHTLIVMFLRTLNPESFPSTPPLPWEDESGPGNLTTSLSSLSINPWARNRIASAPASEYGGGSRSDFGGGRSGPAPKPERLFELVMPEPLSAKPAEDADVVEVRPPPPSLSGNNSIARPRRGSMGSASLSNWKGLRKSSVSSSKGEVRASPSLAVPGVQVGALPQTVNGKTPLPPVSFPSAKRYHFRNHPDALSPHSSPRSRTSSESGRPGSIWSVDDAMTMSGNAPPVPNIPRNFVKHMKSPSEAGSARPQGRHSPTTSSNLRFNGLVGHRPLNDSPTQSRYFRGDATPPSEPIEPAFARPLPFIAGRAPILRVFVPLSEDIPTWPSSQGARKARAELERAGAWGKLRLGDIIINTALQDPLAGRHLMLFAPSMQPFLVPLGYKYSALGHLPLYLDSLTLPPSYYYPILSPPHIISVDLTAWADKALTTLRLAFDRQDITTARGDKIVAKRYLHVAGFQITPNARFGACEEWEGMVTVEAQGTAEGRNELIRRFGRDTADDRLRIPVGPCAWEIVKEKSLGGSVWLRVVAEPDPR